MQNSFRSLAATPRLRATSPVLLWLAVLFGHTEEASAACGLQFPDNARHLQLSLPSAISLGRDASVGSVVFSREFPILDRTLQYGGCDATGSSVSGTGSQPLVGGQTNIYRSGIEGVGLRFTVRSLFRSSVFAPVTATVPFNVDVSVGFPFGMYWHADNFVRVELIKMANVTGSGAVTPGQYVAVTLNDGRAALTASIPANGIRVNTVSCTTPDFTVNLGTHAHTELRTINSFTSSTNFSIPLNNCPAGIRSIRYKVDAVTAILDADRAVVALNGSSTANGVGVQLLDGSGNVHPFGTTRTATGINAAGGNFTIPLRARYFRTGAGIGGGTANTSMTFTISYE